MTEPKDVTDRASYAAMRDMLYQASAIKDDASRFMLAAEAASLLAERNRLRERIFDGTISSDESRGFAAISNALVKVLKELGTSILPDPDDEFAERWAGGGRNVDD